MRERQEAGVKMDGAWPNVDGWMDMDGEKCLNLLLSVCLCLSVYLCVFLSPLILRFSPEPVCTPVNVIRVLAKGIESKLI